MARNIDVLVAYLDGLPHRTRRGHWPVWMELGAGRRQCVNCLKGGHRPPVVRVRQLSPLGIPL